MANLGKRALRLKILRETSREFHIHIKVRNMAAKQELDWLKLRQQCEEWVRTGESQKIAQTLSRLPQRDMPRRWRLPLANCARRAGLYYVGLRLLSPILKTAPGDEELAEYGVLLQKIGSLREALSVLEKLDGEKLPEVWLYRCFCLFQMWDYEAARPLLQKYVSHREVNGYARLIGKVNLAAIHVWTGSSEALPLLEEILAEGERQGLTRLQGNALELMAQIYIKQEQWSEAEAKLARAGALLAQDFSLDYFFVRKWSAVIAAVSSGDATPLLNFRREAMERRHWPTVREVDFHLLKIKRDEALFNRLYFGTPYAGYRRRLRQHFPEFAIPMQFTLGSGPSTLNLMSGEFDGRQVLKPGGALHRFAACLLKDFYRPQSLGAVYSEVFPREVFNVFSSPNRIHQLAKKLRQLGLPFELHNDQGTYSLQLRAGLQVRLWESARGSSVEEARLQQLQQIFAEQWFSAREARERLSLPITTLNRMLSFGLKQGLLRKTGAGAQVRYQFCAGSEIVNTAA